MKPAEVEVLLCYSSEDAPLCRELVVYLSGLQRQGFLTVWYDHEISPGVDYELERDKHLDTANIILLLVSQYFMNSNYCYLVQMHRAIQRHEHGDARVIPVLLRPVYFQNAPFAKLMPLPTNKKPVTDSSWHSLDEAFFDVAEGIRKTSEELTLKLSANGAIPLPPHALDGEVVRSTLSINHQYQSGDKVHHDRFGEGIVLKSEIEQGIEFLEIQFKSVRDKKIFSLNFSELKKL